MSEVKRYLVTLVEGDAGAWVHYDDHQAALAKAVADERVRVTWMANDALARFRHLRAIGDASAAMGTLEDFATKLTFPLKENNDGC